MGLQIEPIPFAQLSLGGGLCDLHSGSDGFVDRTLDRTMVPRVAEAELLGRLRKLPDINRVATAITCSSHQALQFIGQHPELQSGPRVILNVTDSCLRQSLSGITVEREWTRHLGPGQGRELPTWVRPQFERHPLCVE